MTSQKTVNRATIQHTEKVLKLWGAPHWGAILELWCGGSELFV
jgi:hypothetical protein